MFAGQAHAEKNDSRGRNGCLLNGAWGGRLDYVRRGVTNRAVRMRQPIRMKVCLLNADADDKKDGADYGKQKVSAHIGRPILPHVWHRYQLLYASLAAILSRRGAGIDAIDTMAFMVATR